MVAPIGEQFHFNSQGRAIMKKSILAFLLLFFPLLGRANNGASLSFAPPPSDYSVVFLGNIFGIVDGVLHGTGSQIMGSMFSVFNAAVLALGGIIIMYTLIVGTMNTAHEGEMLGKKWSSIWIPIRSTMGLALLIPKASGYCLMQIFVMWVVVQGIGAADKVWDAALSYLNRGGVIIRSQMDSVISVSADNKAIANGAYVILSGQVCMVGIQKQLENQRQLFLNAQAKGSGPCAGDTSSSSNLAVQLCNNAVPDFPSTVNAVSVQSQNPNSTQPYVLQMPNFDQNSMYARLNGICGTISWKSMQSKLDNVSTIPSDNSTVTVSQTEMATATMSRAIAIQQMYVDLLTVARSMVNNDPQLNTSTGTSAGSSPFSSIASDQFGVPYLDTGYPCTKTSNNCTQWGADTSSYSATLFNGTEFQGAIADYNGIMLPTLNLISQSNDANVANAAREFISQSEARGWIVAGSYFFDLVNLNGSATHSSNQVDSDSGLEQSTFNASDMTAGFAGGSCNGSYSLLCSLFNGSQSQVDQVVTLINGAGIADVPSPPNVDQANTSSVVQTGVGSSTVFGYINNGVIIQMPNQPGLEAPSFTPDIKITPTANLLKLPNINFACGGRILGVCIMRSIAESIYSLVLKPLVNIVLNMIDNIFSYLILNFLSAPLTIIVAVFAEGVSFIQDPGANPIVALAKMGTHYINYSMSLWIQLVGLSVIFGLVPGFAAVLALIGPLLFAWLGVMVAIGLATAYYVPFLPYMIFTFGTIAWLMAVIEAMVAGPIVALGITHPEGEGILGKGEQALMILLNVFLRPAMMIIGYITAIALCYVAVWIINAGFTHFSGFMSGNAGKKMGYVNWASIYGGFFIIIVYAMLYMTVVEKSFNLIHVLPDKVLRWIGGKEEQSDVAQWLEQTKQKVKEGGTETEKASGAISSKLKAHSEQGIDTAASRLGTKPPPKVDLGGE